MPDEVHATVNWLQDGLGWVQLGAKAWQECFDLGQPLVELLRRLMQEDEVVDKEGRETWRINVEVKRGGEVVVPVVAGDRTYVDRGLAQASGSEVGARLIAERGL